MSTLTPIQKTARIQIIDIIRGFAILGILMVNIIDFSQPQAIHYLASNTSWLHQGGILLVKTLFLNKFYTIFSFLFGLGMSIQLRRAQAKGVPFVPLYARRLGWLFVFGLLHTVLLWNGDILMLYAMTGIYLLLLRNWPPRRLIITAAVLFALLLIAAAIFSESETGGASPHDPNPELTIGDQARATGAYRTLVTHRLDSIIDEKLGGSPFILLVSMFALFELRN